MPNPHLRILLADDQRILRAAVSTLLTEEGDLEVVAEAEDGQAAVELAVQLQPDVVLMDVNMPVLDGIEATRQITEMCPGARVIVLSMHEGDAMARIAYNAGAAAYVSKSADPDKLLHAIRAR